MKATAYILLCLLHLAATPLLADNAPVTTIATVVNAVPGASSVPVPVTVTGFTNIAQFTLIMTFDTARVRYVSSTINSSLPGMTVTYTPPSHPPTSNRTGTLKLTWSSAANVSLADGSAIANLVFSYVTGSGFITWDGSSCVYKRWVGATLTTLTDTPKSDFYKDGGIASRGAPVTFAPVVTPSAAGTIALPVTVNDFTTIGSITLYMQYDPAVITYLNTFTKNAAFGGSFVVGDQAWTNGKRVIVIQWYGNSVTLANGSVMCTLNFTYITAGTACALTWFENGPSCEYTDAGGVVLIDTPTASFYHDGAVAPPLLADFSANSLTPALNAPVAFTDLTTGGPTSWTWSFDRPGVVYLNGTTAASQNPQVKFTAGGLYTVTLVAQNAWLSNAQVKTGYIRAGTAGVWTGETSGDWALATNWENWLVPGSGTGVTIPSSAANWPVYTGNLTVGVHCASISLVGATSRLTVTGILTLP